MTNLWRCVKPNYYPNSKGILGILHTWFGYHIYIMFRVANFEKGFLGFERDRKMQKKNLEGETFWDSLVLFFHHSKNLQRLQVDVTLTLRVNHYKSHVFLWFNFSHWYCRFQKIGLGCFNPKNQYQSFWLWLRVIDG